MNSEDSNYTIAFYNVENLFSVNDDLKTIDLRLLPVPSRNWTKQRYEKKIFNLGLAISKIGFSSLNKPPVLIGLAEVENEAVLHDLVNGQNLKTYNYGFVHYNSLDERGMDVALLYNKDEFTVANTKAFPIYIKEMSGNRDFTRDILLVTGYLAGIKIHVLVNHWPSRHEGKDASEFKRTIAATQIANIITSLKDKDRNAQIIVMGDFNDNPTNPNIIKLKYESNLINTMESFWSYRRGSTNHNFTWLLFDQIFLSQNFFEKEKDSFMYLESDIFDEPFITQYDGKYKGQPLRTFAGRKYKGGFSDHFPVYIQIGKSGKK